MRDACDGSAFAEPHGSKFDSNIECPCADEGLPRSIPARDRPAFSYGPQRSTRPCAGCRQTRSRSECSIERPRPSRARHRYGSQERAAAKRPKQEHALPKYLTFGCRNSASGWCAHGRRNRKPRPLTIDPPEIDEFQERPLERHGRIVSGLVRTHGKIHSPMRQKVWFEESGNTADQGRPIRKSAGKAGRDAAKIPSGV